MPYRVDLPAAPDDAFERLIELGALDIEVDGEGTLSALMPDDVAAAQVARAAGAGHVRVSPATGRDDGSVWRLGPRPVRIGRLRIAPPDERPAPDTIRLVDAPTFGTGAHPTTALCLEALVETIDAEIPEAVLDVGTGSGILAIAALLLGVPHATALDVDAGALRTAATNARLNGVEERLSLVHGGPDILTGAWPVVLANVQAAPLAEMAPMLVRRVGHGGRLVLSGVAAAVEPDVSRAYRHQGMRQVRVTSRDGWVALWLRATW